MFHFDLAAMELVFGEFGEGVPVLFVGSEYFPWFEAAGLSVKRELVAMESRFDFQFAQLWVSFVPSDGSCHSKPYGGSC